MKLQQVMSRVRKALDDYHMIDEGDRIAIGVSGGKDSLTLLYAMAEIRRFYPVHFELEAISVDLGFAEKVSYAPIEALCRDLRVNYTIVPSEVAEIVFNVRQESNPCSLCAKLRKGAFNTKARELGCNKIAYAHHKDDIVETLLMSLIYEGRLHTFAPVTYLDRMDLTLIRPLIYMDEADVIGFKNMYHLPVQKNPCPADGFTRREYAKDLIKDLNREAPGVKNRMFTAIVGSGIDGWGRGDTE
ncbi:MAG: tRNA 2-thiocytidine biosynthesis protein TtcA [Lachnospiraceae bacterium]|nr:tRNA 2-thiocytidine biosynthesis protein TtcA [Lachnospiraceae bacterium]